MTDRVEKAAKVPLETNEPLHVKYRPKAFKHVVGQSAVVKALERMMTKRTTQAVLLSGPSGCGKTTLARIAADVWGCSPDAIVDLDAATHSGIDNMRAIQEVVRYRGFGQDGRKAIIVDECHGLSKQAWDALLKTIEEPPPHVIWFFCTTNPTKVPQTVKTRCASLQLKAVADDDLEGLADFVCDEERIDIDDRTFRLCVSNAQGSPRQLLVNLEVCREAKNHREAAELLKTALESDATIELCRYLMTRGSWAKAMAIVDKLTDDPEGVRIIIMNYYGKVIAGAKNDKAAVAALNVLENFKTPYNASEGKAPLLLSIGRTLFAG